VRCVYVAGRFRADTDEGVEANIARAEALGLEVAKLGASPVIPHANTRSLHHHIDEKWMLEATLELMRRCDAVVLTEGWQESSGTRDEICEANWLGIPVFYTLFGLKSWLEGLK
jgi:nucleoside 2-deoxyribosyltransferase